MLTEGRDIQRWQHLRLDEPDSTNIHGRSPGLTMNRIKRSKLMYRNPLVTIEVHGDGLITDGPTFK